MSSSFVVPQTNPGSERTNIFKSKYLIEMDLGGLLLCVVSGQFSL